MAQQAPCNKVASHNKFLKYRQLSPEQQAHSMYNHSCPVYCAPFTHTLYNQQTVCLCVCARWCGGGRERG
jgi:hypothetical protein